MYLLDRRCSKSQATKSLNWRRHLFISPNRASTQTAVLSRPDAYERRQDLRGQPLVVHTAATTRQPTASRSNTRLYTSIMRSPEMLGMASPSSCCHGFGQRKVLLAQSRLGHNKFEIHERDHGDATDVWNDVFVRNGVDYVITLHAVTDDALSFSRIQSDKASEGNEHCHVSCTDMTRQSASTPCSGWPRSCSAGRPGCSARASRCPQARSSRIGGLFVSLGNLNVIRSQRVGAG